MAVLEFLFRIVYKQFFGSVGYQQLLVELNRDLFLNLPIYVDTYVSPLIDNIPIGCYNYHEMLPNGYGAKDFMTKKRCRTSGCVGDRFRICFPIIVCIAKKEQNM